MPRKKRLSRGTCLACSLLERGAEDAGQVADILGDQEVVLHEALDAVQAGMRRCSRGGAAISRCRSKDSRSSARPVRKCRWQRTAQRKSSAALEERDIPRRERTPALDQLVAGADAVEIFGDPEQRLQVAQAALALLDVGLDQVARAARRGVALVALGELGGDELARRALHDLGLEARAAARRTALRRRQIAALRGSRCGSVMSARARRMHSSTVRVAWPTFRPQVPQHVEDVFDDALAPGRLLVGKEEQQIDVGARRQRAAAIAADRDQRQRSAADGLLDAEDVRASAKSNSASMIVSVEHGEPFRRSAAAGRPARACGARARARSTAPP